MLHKEEKLQQEKNTDLHRLLPRVWHEGEGVDVRGDVAGDARVDVVVPGAANPGRLLQDDKVLDAGVKQPLGLAQP